MKMTGAGGNSIGVICVAIFVDFFSSFRWGVWQQSLVNFDQVIF